jgi:hypothetical protein
MTSIQYLNEKISDALYILTVDEGDSRTRLAKVIPKLIHLSVSSFPIEVQQDYEWILITLNRGIGIHYEGFPPTNKLTGITNKTASKVIVKLIFIQDKLDLFTLE